MLYEDVIKFFYSIGTRDTYIQEPKIGSKNHANYDRNNHDNGLCFTKILLNLFTLLAHDILKFKSL